MRRSTNDFYPRPPRGGRPIGFHPPFLRKEYFYPRPPRGGRPEVFIPFSEYVGRLDTGDYLVRGICPYVYNGTVKPLVQEYKAKSILRLTMCDYGSPDMQHWEVSAG